MEKESTISVVESNDKTDNLCDFCSSRFPDCSATIKFGQGVGNDNIIGCNIFQNDSEVTEGITRKEISKEEFENNYQ